MKTSQLGNIGIEVSSLCLGAMYFGSKNDEATSYRMLDQYLDTGGTFIDTANIYAWWVEGYQGGESETLMGKWMAERCARCLVRAGYSSNRHGNRLVIWVSSDVGAWLSGFEP